MINDVINLIPESIKNSIKVVKTELLDEGLFEEAINIIFRPLNEGELIAFINFVTLYGFKFKVISSGLNVGFGTRYSNHENDFLIDLGEFKWIKQVSENLIEIGAGVTQQEALQFLENSNYTINVTGSSMDSSVLGNSLERGVGFQGQKLEDITSLDVALMNGKTITCGGFTHLGEHLKNTGYKSSVGTDLKSLFFQTGYGIVTSGIFRLHRKDIGGVLKITFSEESLEKVTQVVIKLLEEGLFRPVVKIFSPQSIKIQSNQTNNCYCLYAHTAGSENSVKLIKTIVESEFRETSIGDILLLNFNEQLTKVDTQILNGIRGVYSDNEQFREILDELSESKLRLHTPIVINKYESLSRVINIVESLNGIDDTELGFTLNFIDPFVVDMVIFVKKNINSELDKISFLSINNKLSDLMLSEGFHCYRTSSDKSNFVFAEASNEYQEVLLNLKQAFDPKHNYNFNKY